MALLSRAIKISKCVMNFVWTSSSRETATPGALCLLQMLVTNAFLVVLQKCSYVFGEFQISCLSWSDWIRKTSSSQLTMLLDRAIKKFKLAVLALDLSIYLDR